MDQLLASLRIDPRELPARLNHVHGADWHDAWRAGAAVGAHPPPSAAAELAAGAQWDAVWAGQRGGPMPPHAMAGPQAMA